MKKVVLITGASSGIGRATAEKLLNTGYSLLGSYDKVISLSL